MAPLASSNSPTTTNGPAPATSNSPVPETVPLPTLRKSTPARRLATRFENGTDPATKPRAIEAGEPNAITRADLTGGIELLMESFLTGVPAGTSQPEGTPNHQNGSCVPYPGGGADDRRKEH